MAFKFLAAFLIVTFGYVLLYAGYGYLNRSMPGRVVFICAVVSGTLIGSTLGARWFR